MHKYIYTMYMCTNIYLIYKNIHVCTYIYKNINIYKYICML